MSKERINACLSCTHRQKPPEVAFGLVNSVLAECYKAVQYPKVWKSPMRTILPGSCPQGREDLRIAELTGKLPETALRFDKETKGKWDFTKFFEE